MSLFVKKRFPILYRLSSACVAQASRLVAIYRGVRRMGYRARVLAWSPGFSRRNAGMVLGAGIEALGCIGPVSPPEGGTPCPDEW